MNIHEYQAKQLLKGYGCPVADGVPILSKDDVEAAIAALPGPLYVVCLLYTSPSPRDGLLSRMPSSA